MCRPDWQTVSRSAAALGRWRTRSPRTSRRPCASPMGTGGRRCARGRPRSWIRSPDVVPPITDRNRGAVFRFEGTKSDARHHYHHLRPFARFQPSRVPFRSASSPPVAPFPSACSPFPLGVEGNRNRGQEMNFCERRYPGSRIGNFPIRVRVTARGSAIGDPEISN